MWNSCRSDGVWLQLSYTVVEPEDGGAVQERPTASTAAEAAHQEWHVAKQLNQEAASGFDSHGRGRGTRPAQS